MRRIGVAGLLVLIMFALSGVTAGSASATYVCRQVRWFAWYHKFGSPECEELAIIFAWKGWDLVDVTGAKEIEPGVLCVLVEAGTPSDYDGPSCGKAEVHEGESEYVETEGGCGDNEPEPGKFPSRAPTALTEFVRVRSTTGSAEQAAAFFREVPPTWPFALAGGISKTT